MPNTTIPALESINLLDLEAVSGGCHKKCSSSASSASMVNSNNTYLFMPQIVQPPAAPVPCAPPPEADPGPAVSTSVSYA